MNDHIYVSDPDRASDSQFMPGELSFLVDGNRGRLLDLRRTPVHVTRVMPDAGFFEVEIDDFEDAGARWLVPLEEVASYQFAADGAMADSAAVDELRDAAARCNFKLSVTGGEMAEQHTINRINKELYRSAAWLDAAGAPDHFNPLPFIEEASGWPAAVQWLETYMAERGLADLETVFAAAYVSNPWAGDWVLAHLVVMAELGLGQYCARAIRDPSAFDDAWTRRRRAEHILARAGFARALWARSDSAVMLYRGVGIQSGASNPGGGKHNRRVPLVSASFSRRVAESHFDSPNASSGVLYRQPLQLDRLFMTFLETEAMSRRYREAEALLMRNSGPCF